MLSLSLSSASSCSFIVVLPSYSTKTQFYRRLSVLFHQETVTLDRLQEDAPETPHQHSSLRQDQDQDQDQERDQGQDQDHDENQGQAQGQEQERFQDSEKHSGHERDSHLKDVHNLVEDAGKEVGKSEL